MESRPARSDWWDVDGEVLAALRAGARSPEEIAAVVGMSPAAVTSVVGMLAREGRVRIRLVELVATVAVAA